MPKTKNPRGPATQAAITENVVQLDLFFAAGVPMVLKVKPTTGLVTRFLLVHRAQSEIRAELSVPADMEDGGKVDAFTERIILEPIPLDAGPNPKRFDEGDGVDVPVRRKKK
jgi:hypothetical protein